MGSRTLTAVPGLRVGHATAADRSSGCTVVLGPARAAAEVRGMATGSRELGVLAPEHLVPRVDGVLLTGGSAFGLAAADGVMAWLAERGEGYDTGVARVPIVPAAVLFDLRDGSTRPGAEMGRAACEVASDAEVAEGRVGAGAGATVGKIAGLHAAVPGGLGSSAAEEGGFSVGAMAAVNALGNVVDATGRIVAGSAAGGADPSGPVGFPGTNTTLAVVATDAPLSRTALLRLARVATNALARRIHPVSTPFDGDVVFALSTAPEGHEMAPDAVLRLAMAAQAALEEAIVRAVTAGER